MITNKDLSIDSKNGQVILNGDKYDLGTQGEIDAAVKDVYSVMGQMGAKNLIPRPYAEGEYKSYRNMTYTVNTDGTITATATQALTGDATFTLYGPTDTEELVLKAGVKYVLSGDPGASGVERIVVAGRSAAGGTSETLIINNTGVPKEYTPDEDKVITQIYIRNYAGASMPTPYNETFKPMLRLASDTDDTYQPYAKTNRQLTDQVTDINNTIGDITQTGITGASVAAQLAALQTGALKVAEVSGTVDSTTADANAIGGYRTVGQTTKALSSFTGYPTGKTVVGWALSAYGSNAAVQAIVNVGGGNVYLNSAYSGTFTVNGFVFYID